MAAMNESGYIPYRSHGWRGRIRTDWAQRLGAIDALQWVMDQPHESVADRSVAQTLLLPASVSDDRPAIYVKHLPQVSKLRSPVMRTLSVTHAMARAGLGVPSVILAAQRRHGASRENILMTNQVDGQSVQSLIWPTSDDAACRQCLREVGRHIARLHQHGFLHGDLLPGNLIQTPGGELVYMDNDRTRKFPWLPLSIRQRNLTQMMYRCMTFLPWSVARSFLDGYFEKLSISESRRRRCIAKVVRNARPRVMATYREQNSSRRYILQYRKQSAD